MSEWKEKQNGWWQCLPCIIWGYWIRDDLIFFGFECFLWLWDEVVEHEIDAAFELSFVSLSDLVPGPALASTTCLQLRNVPGGSFFHLLTKSTQALQISPDRFSLILKHFSNSDSYFFESVNRELDDLALQIQQPDSERYILGLWKLNIILDWS